MTTSTRMSVSSPAQAAAGVSSGSSIKKGNANTFMGDPCELFLTSAGDNTNIRSAVSNGFVGMG